MRKSILFALCALTVTGCAKHDPILPGIRTDIFDAGRVKILNQEIENLPHDATESINTDCPYRQDASNVIWRGDKKIFSGFPTSNSVKSVQSPVCDNAFIYAGLTTGELVKVNGKTRDVAWVADIYRPSNMTGGASVLDIIAPIRIFDGAVYAGGLGDAFCRINPKTGAKKWCANIGTAHAFEIAGDAAFVAATDGNLYALRTSDGAAYWMRPIKTQDAVKYANKIVTVGKQTFNAETGTEIK